jgi:transcriptional regulator with XRE-family HTH domain
MVASNDRRDGNSVDVAVGARLMVIMERRKMKFADLAAVLMVPEPDIQNYCNGKQRIGAATLLQLSAILHVPLDWFFSDNLPSHLVTPTKLSDTQCKD